MGDKSAIEWTDATLNVVTGCTKVSPACANCYIAGTPPFRIAGRKFVKGHIPLVLHEDRLMLPLRWTKPRKIFVNSLSDLFHDDVPDELIDKLFGMMALAPQHVFQILTKRPERMLAYMLSRARDTVYPEMAIVLHPELVNGKPFQIRITWPLPNVWLGVSVENQHWADKRIPLLLQTPAAVHFISAEPLLGFVNLRGWGGPGWVCKKCEVYQSAQMAVCVNCREPNPWKGTIGRLDWVIGGFESGRRRRDGNVDHARFLRDQCAKEGIAFMWKQNGGLTSKAGGRLLDGRTHDEYPSAQHA